MGIGGALLGQAGAGALGRYANLSPGAQSLLEDAGGFAGGGCPARLTPGLLSAVGTGARNLTGMTTGRGRVGIDAAVEGSPQFMNAMRGNVSEQQLADKVGAARDVLHNQADAQYRQDYAALPTARLPLAARVPTQIENGINGILDKFEVKGTPTGDLDFSRSHIPDAVSQNEIKGIVDIVRTWGRDPGDYTPQGLDILKKQLNNKIVETGPGSAATTQMKNVVQNVLENHVPGYKAMTKKYAEAQELIRNVEDEFSLETRNPGTAVRKVMGVQNQPNGNNYRADLLKKLDAATGTNVSDEALGMGFRGVMPQPMGDAALPLAGGAALAYLGHPSGAGILSGLGLLSESPRFMGETAAAMGRLNRAIPANRAPVPSGVLGGLLSLDPQQ